MTNGLPSAVRISHAAQALEMRERTIRGYCERGIIKYTQPGGPGTMRYIPLHELYRFAKTMTLEVNDLLLIELS